MEANPYNLIAFQFDAYTYHARLTITPGAGRYSAGLHGLEAVDNSYELPAQELPPLNAQALPWWTGGAGDLLTQK